MKSMFLVTVFMVIFSIRAGAAEYAIDTDHSTVGFKIRHLFSWVNGTYDTFEGSFVYEPEVPDNWSVSAKIDASSINTNVAPRDKHLRSADFFDVEKYPSITFKSTEVTDVAGDTAKLHGILSLHGVEKQVVLDLEIHGVGEDPWGNVKSGFTATTTVNRTDFGLNWNETLESGKLLVGEEVKITIDVEGIQQGE